MSAAKKTTKMTEKKMGGKGMKETHMQKSSPIELSHTGEFAHATVPSASGEMGGTGIPIDSTGHLEHHGTGIHHGAHHDTHHGAHHGAHHGGHHDAPEPLPREHNLRTHHGYNLRFPAK